MELQQEAEDHAELETDKGDGGGLGSMRSAKGPRRLLPERSVFRLATQQRAARHLRAQEGLEMDAISLSAISGVFWS